MIPVSHPPPSSVTHVKVGSGSLTGWAGAWDTAKAGSLGYSSTGGAAAWELAGLPACMLGGSAGCVKASAGSSCAVAWETHL